MANALRSGDDVETLRRRHDDIERRLAVLDRHISLTSDEQAERSQIKKEKLWVKDRMAELSAGRLGPRSVPHR